MKFTKTFGVSPKALSGSQKDFITILEKVGEKIASIYENYELDDNGNSNFYPESVSKEDILASSEDDEAILDPFTFVRIDDDGNLYAEAYEVVCAEELKEIAELLNEAAEVTDDEVLSVFCAKTAENLVNGRFDDVLFDYLKLGQSEIDFLVGPISCANDAKLGVKKSFEFWLAVKVHDKEVEKFQKIVELAENLPILAPIDSILDIGESPNIKVEVYNAIMFAGSASQAVPSVRNLPEERNLILEHGSRVNFYKNRIAEKGEELMRLCKGMIDIKASGLECDPEKLTNAYLRLIALHVISEIVVAYPDGSERLHEYTEMIVELNAFMLALRSAVFGVVSDAISLEDYHYIISALLMYGIGVTMKRKRSSAVKKFSDGLIMAFNKAHEVGLFEIVDDKIVINFDLSSEMTPFSSMILDVYRDGTQEDAERLIQKYGDYSLIDGIISQNS